MTGPSKLLVWLRALASAGVIAALTAGVPWLLVATVGSPYPDAGIDWARPLTDEALLGLLAALAWVFWVQMVVCLVVEAVAEIRTARGAPGDWLTRVPATFGGQQHLARVLVNAIVAVGLGAGGPTNVTGPGIGTDWGWSQARPTAYVPAHDAPPVRHTTHPDSSRGKDRAQFVTVAKGDTLWSIAEEHLGAGELWKRIAELNQGRLMPDGAHFTQSSVIRPGWTILVPELQGRRSNQVTVETGDTLWKIAEEEYGNGDSWHRLYVANRGQVADPDLIHPGQVLKVPARPTPQDRQAAGTNGRPLLRGDAPPTGTPHQPAPLAGGIPPEPSPRERQERAVTLSPAPGPASPPSSSHQSAEDGTSSLVILLTGGGGLLAASALALFVLRRRAQTRLRRTGRIIARTPPHLAPTERVIRQAGSTATDRATFLNLALRDLSHRLSVHSGRLPDVAAARIDEKRLDLLLNDRTPNAPAPWVCGPDEQVWSISREARLDECDSIAPYPALVSVGVDEEGGTWLLDLEAAGVVGILGDAAGTVGLARFIAAELAVNVWADDVDTVVSGFGDELGPMRPGRVRHADAPPFEDLAKTARRVSEATRTMGYDVLAGRMDGRGADTFMPAVLVDVADDAHRDVVLPPDLAHLDCRQAVALVLVGHESSSGGARVTVERDGLGTLHPWDVRLRLNLLTATEAAGIAGLLEHADLAEDEQMPPAEGGSALDELVDAAGAVRPELVHRREPESSRQTLLPEADEHYLSCAATTAEDVEVLAPVVPEQTKNRILALDPDLDRDLADWENPDSPRPKLRLLGPIEVAASGERTMDIERRLAYYTEIVAYLATRDHGATPEQTAGAFNVQNNSVHSRVGSVRQWLGADPETGEWYLPESTLSPSAKARGIPTYELVRALCDADLFRRLRARAQARGSAGMEDLVTALRLVRGAPFEQPRRGGYGWLADTPVDHYLTAAVVDVAHIVSTDAMVRGDMKHARWAAEIAMKGAPSDDRPRLDLAAVIEADSGVEAARSFLSSSLNDLADGPLDPHGAREDIIDRRAWG